MKKQIFNKYDTDKGFFSDYYDDVFNNIRNDIKLVFEIGVNRGGSVRAFREYFPNAQIVGIEINPPCWFDENRIKIEIGDATNKEFIESIISRYGYPDVVIDDGSHFSSDIKSTFNILYDYTKYYYIIEDLGTQYVDYHNGFYINDGIPATNIVHQLIDNTLSLKSINMIKIYPSICFIIKR